jgi:hypothetical protein
LEFAPYDMIAQRFAIKQIPFLQDVKNLIADKIGKRIRMFVRFWALHGIIPFYLLVIIKSP